MCGFILAPEALVKDPEVALSAIRHRGADAQEGYEHVSGWFLGHTRLAVATEGDEGRQPFWDRHGRPLAFVGEVFDGTVSRSSTRTERHLEFDEIEFAMGTPNLVGFHAIDGFWSVVRLDPNLGSALIVTDHLGIKPVYYWPEHNIYCSEVEPMFTLVDRPPLDEIYLSNCIKFGYDYSGRTPWQGIYQMPPGSFIVANLSQALWKLEHHPHRYWDWNLVANTKDLVSELEHATIRRVTQSKHPVGLLYSGGLDSSIIRAILQKHKLLGEVEVFSIPEEGKAYSEDVTLTPCPQYDAAGMLDVVAEMQQPTDLGSMLPQHHLAVQLENNECRTTLTGDGADELFGGYKRQYDYDAQTSDVFCELPYYHLPRLDRIMMAHGVEVRAPFLAPKVVKYALGLKYTDRINKKALREAFRGYGPLSNKEIDMPKHPLKSEAVLTGGFDHRSTLVNLFRLKEPV